MGSLDETISALSRLNELSPANDKFQRDLYVVILDPVLLSSMDGYGHQIQVKDSAILVDSKPSAVSVSDVLDSVLKVLSFLRQYLPESIFTSFSTSLLPILSSKIISHWLSTAIPTDLDGLSGFETILSRVLQFAQDIETLGWHGQEELVSWANQAPRLWLTRRRVDSLDRVRKVLASSKGDTRQVERVETKQVSETDEVLLENSNSDDWDAGWDDEKDDEPQNDAEEDVSAWGLEDETDDTKPFEPENNSGVSDDEAGDAWGWAEDDEQEQPPAEEPQPKTAATTNPAKTEQASAKEITLRENYTITDVPDSILQIVQQQVSDSETISNPSYVPIMTYIKLHLTQVPDNLAHSYPPQEPGSLPSRL